jgi:hypothetical protein
VTRSTLVVAILIALPRFAAAQAATGSAAAPPPVDKPVEAAPPATVPTPPPASPPADKEGPVDRAFSWHPFGYLRMQYIAVQNDPNVAFVGRDDGFELQNARVGVRGDLGLRASFVVAIDGAIDERQINSPQGKIAVGLRDAFMDVRLSGATMVRGGYFLAWVDPESMVPDTSREFVDHPLESRGMRSTEGWYTPGLPPGRSMGAAIRMDPAEPKEGAAFGYELAVQNGADEFASNNDNDQPAVSAAGVLRLPHEGYVIAAVRWNPRTVGDLPFRQDETDYQGTFGAHIVAGPISLGAGLIVQRTNFESTGGPSQDAYGAHGQVLFRFGGEDRPMAIGYRFAVLDPSSLITTDRVMEHTVGAVMGVPSYRMRVQVQAVHVVEQAERDLSNDRIQLAAEVSL